MAGLQAQLDDLLPYADCWGLTVNVDKTKAVIYRAVRAPVCSNPSLMYDGKSIEFVESFKYLGIDLHCTQPFAEAGLPRKGVWSESFACHLAPVPGAEHQ